MEEKLLQMDCDYWNLVINIGRLLATVIVAFLAGWLGHRYWKKQKDIENKLKRQEMQFANRAEALKAVWGLLEFLSEREYPKTIMVDRGTPEQSVKFLRMDRAKEFIELIPKILYEQGHGIFLSAEAEEKLMALRGKFYRFIEGILREDLKKRGDLAEEDFFTTDGFFKMIDDREEKMFRIKNPNYAKNILETAAFLRNYLHEELTSSP